MFNSLLRKVAVFLAVLALGFNSSARSVSAQENIDEEKIFYVVYGRQSSGDSGYTNLTSILMNADGTNRRVVYELTRTWFITNNGAVWSSDGTMLALFVCTANTPYVDPCSLFVLNADGTELFGEVQNMQVRLNITRLSWSPDSQQIAFEGYDYTTQTTGVYTMNPDGSQLEQLVSEGLSPAWSPDGEQIVFARWSNVPPYVTTYIMDSDGGNIQQIEDFLGYNLQWSVRNHIAAQKPGDSNFTSYVLSIIDIDGTYIGTIPHPGRSSGFSWSPNGEQIAFSSETEGAEDIYIVNEDGTGLLQLTHSQFAWSPVWSQDGTKIAYFSRQDDNTQIYVMNADGTDQHSITNDNEVKGNLSWVP